MQLGRDQTRALDAFLSKRNIFITGVAGTGKSYLLRRLIQEAKQGSVLKGTPQEETEIKTVDDVFVTASTGIAAVGIGGTTLHSFAGCGLLDNSLEWHSTHMRADARARWCRTRVLVVDEVSMLPADLWEKLDKIVRVVRNRVFEVFGGIQLVLVGDFLQLEPVKGKMAFRSKIWPQLAQEVIILREVFRQRDAKTVRVLGELRLGEVSEECRALMAECHARAPPKGCGPSLPKRQRGPVTSSVNTRLVPTNKEAQAYNEAKLAALAGRNRVFKGIARVQGGTKRDRDMLVKNCLAPERLELKVGAPVCLLKNLDLSPNTDQALCNGSQGIVIGFDDGGPDDDEKKKKVTSQQSVPKKKTKPTSFPVVQFVNGRTQTILPAKWEVASGHNILATFVQVPLVLAWAMTIHKSQGMTLQRATLSLGRVFAQGQAYVALSRVQDFRNLTLLDPLNPYKVIANQQAVSYYRSLAPPGSPPPPSPSSPTTKPTTRFLSIHEDPRLTPGQRETLSKISDPRTHYILHQYYVGESSV